ncbi:hypothetical protein GCM10011352_40640 [Marinobacterium zhoushanense]|uniref:YggT family protein n=1 Tax=Marinobacterium zhoushanense TaxID=1679163 RepID=A0ABQ1KZ23_9GAMM|nr:hypothetical protein [Marinobacterium zhoushanense]GGC10051.1 hypothetical protein GCM10011352_40640 [Marinobacterium zhoushanense]
MIYLAIIEPFLFWGGLLVFLTSLGLYVKRTQDWQAVLRFWQPLISFTPLEFRINRIGLTLMLIAVVIRFAFYFMA